jgi:hypothetical protein
MRKGTGRSEGMICYDEHMTLNTIVPDGAHVTQRPGLPEKGWTVVEYKGATIKCWGGHNVLEMDGHPYDGQTFGQSNFVAGLVDRWLDRQWMPKGYAIPRRRP